MLKQFSTGIPSSWPCNDSSCLLLKSKAMRTVLRVTPKDYPVSNKGVKVVVVYGLQCILRHKWSDASKYIACFT
jgi:hypothetical protein